MTRETFIALMSKILLLTILGTGCSGDGEGVDGRGYLVDARPESQNPDTIPPNLVLLGGSPDTIFLMHQVPDYRARCMDMDGTELPVATNGLPEKPTVGKFEIQYKCLDSAGNESSATRLVEVIRDSMPPLLALKGRNPDTTYLGAEYRDPGAECFDAVDGALPDSIFIQGQVSTLSESGQSLVYVCKDSTGNVSEVLERTIVVVQARDTLAPDLQLNGPAHDSIPQRTSYLDPGATCIDAEEGDLEQRIERDGTVDGQVPGQYRLEYKCMDGSGNSADSLVRIVTVVFVQDTSPPQITLLGISPDTVEVGDSYVDPGAICLDSMSGALPDTIYSSELVDASSPGSSILKYSCVDDAHNEAVAERVVVRAVQAGLSEEAKALGQRVQVEVFSICAQCHQGQSADGQLDLTYRPNLEVLIRYLLKPSIDLPERPLLVPGDADASYLVWKVEARSGILGDPMPPADVLYEEIDLLKEWIDALPRSFQ